ncbi:MAG TPA: hypothetical protein VEB42_02330 [Chitinophagaceae bacterium]|nr:hypothetical protein [Chitinophagaceae bacterium]
MANVLNIDGSAELHITGAKTGHSVKIEIEFFEDDGVTPKAVPGTVAMQFWSDAARQNKFLKLTDGNGLVISGNKLTIFIKRAENKFSATTYHHTIYTDLNEDESAIIARGHFKVEVGK